MSKDKTPRPIDEGLSSENLKKGLSSANLQNALNKKPATTDGQSSQSNQNTNSPENTPNNDD